MELIELYRRMARARAFELALAQLWEEGLISGELHLGTGEEAIAAALITHLQPGDAVALDHRGTPMLTLLGVDQVDLVREMLGREDGLCGGQGGHMHLFSREHLVATSGIVGASGPLAAGFGLAARQLRPGKVAVALFGDGAVNQGMLLESFNLAAAWSLPVVFVCKDNGWAITTRSREVTGGELVDRARGFGLRALSVDGGDAMAVWRVADEAVEGTREGLGPSFVHASCPRLDGHLLGDLLIRTASSPVTKGASILGEIVTAAVRPRGAGVGDRASSLAKMTGLMIRARGDRRDAGDDPLQRARRRLGRRFADEVKRIDERALREVRAAVEKALEEVDR